MMTERWHGYYNYCYPNCYKIPSQMLPPPKELTLGQFLLSLFKYESSREGARGVHRSFGQGKGSPSQWHPGPSGFPSCFPQRTSRWRSRSWGPGRCWWRRGGAGRPAVDTSWRCSWTQCTVWGQHCVQRGLLATSSGHFLKLSWLICKTHRQQELLDSLLLLSLLWGTEGQGFHSLRKWARLLGAPVSVTLMRKLVCLI